MVVSDDWKGFAAVTFTALVPVVLADEAVVVVPHCELVVATGFDAVAAYLAAYPFAEAALNILCGIETHVHVVLLVPPIPLEVITELVHLMDQL